LLFHRTEKGYPLDIEATNVIEEESPIDVSLLKKLVPKLEYSALRQACQQLAEQRPEDPGSKPIRIPELPDQLPPSFDSSTDDVDSATKQLYEDLHHVLFNIHVIEGALVCPDTKRRFPIKDGIPNMILHEDEL